MDNAQLILLWSIGVGFSSLIIIYLLVRNLQSWIDRRITSESIQPILSEVKTEWKVEISILQTRLDKCMTNWLESKNTVVDLQKQIEDLENKIRECCG
jgi:uncharacterized protein YeeX (DUF496 family)